MPLSQEFHDKAQQIIARYPQQRSALIMLLHEAQDEIGYVSSEVIREVAKVLSLTPADVAGVATFYTMFKRRSPGRYLISMCTNISCSVNGGDATAEVLEALVGPAHRTTEDNLCSWEPVECLAYCNAAPAAQINYEDIPYLTPARAEQLVEGIRRGRLLEEILQELREAASLKEAGGA